MKTIFLLIVLFGSVGRPQSASECMDRTGCADTLNVDSGNSSTVCNDNASQRCTCASMSCHDSVEASTCPTGYTNIGATVTGLNCCHNYSRSCVNEKTEKATEANPDRSIASVFSPLRDANAYFGIVNNVNYSPSTGRAQRIDAMLDSCFADYTILDNIDASTIDPYSQWAACTGSSYCGSSNVYCTDNTDEVCVDRCNCRYQSWLTTNGYSDPGCAGL